MTNESALKILKMWTLWSTILAALAAIKWTKDNSDFPRYLNSFDIAMKGTAVFILTWLALFSGLWIIFLPLYLIAKIQDKIIEIKER